MKTKGPAMDSASALGLFESRKRDHLQLALDSKHQALNQGGWDLVHLTHDALPELNFESVSLKSLRFGQKCAKPFYISGMTAGHPDATRINITLARASQRQDWAMGVGSQRREILDLKEKKLPDAWKLLRKSAPKLTLFANLGLSQLIELTMSKPRRLDLVEKIIDSLEAQALAIHLNALQEVIQPEGTPQFEGGLKAIEYLCKKLSCPVILKETGCGFSSATLQKAMHLGIAAVDVSGLGGTHWGRIEGSRALEQSHKLSAYVSQTFSNWGESTVQSVMAAEQSFRRLKSKRRIEIWGSGGVRSGLDAAKLLALGATQVGYAKPALEKALQSERALVEWMQLQEAELKTALFCTGSKNIRNLKSAVIVKRVGL